MVMEPSLISLEKPDAPELEVGFVVLSLPLLTSPRRSLEEIFFDLKPLKKLERDFL